MARYQAGGASSPVKSIQSGFFSQASPQVASGEDIRYIDITIAAVDPAKSVVDFVGGQGTNVSDAYAKSGSTSSFLCSGRMLNGTTLRVSSAAGGNSMPLSGRWRVVEYN